MNSAGCCRENTCCGFVVNLMTPMFMKTTILYCGTFNPIHNGHLHLILQAAHSLQADKTIIIPSGEVRYKTCLQLASPQDRLQMCKLATESLVNIEVSDYETSNQSICYTCDTIRYFQNLCSCENLVLLMGSDVFISLPYWRNAGEIFEACTICVAIRKEDCIERINLCRQHCLQKGARVQILKIDTIPISSSEIRRQLVAGMEISQWTDSRVRRYIVENNLYQTECK